MQNYFHISTVRRSRFAFHPGLAVAYVFATGAFFVHLQPALLRLPCPWKAVLGIACPTCGSGRSLSALLAWRPAEALAANPLFFLALLLGLLIAFCWLFQLISAVKLQITVSKPVQGWARIAAIALIALNYAYLLFFDI